MSSSIARSLYRLRGLAPLPLVLALTACGLAAPPPEESGSAAQSLSHEQEAERIRSLHEQYKGDRLIALARFHDWLGIPKYDIPERRLRDSIAGVERGTRVQSPLSNMRGNFISYSAGLAQITPEALAAGAVLGNVYTAFEPGPGLQGPIRAGLHAIRVRSDGQGYAAEWIDRRTGQVVRTGPATVSVSSAEATAVTRSPVVTMWLQPLPTLYARPYDLYRVVFDYHWWIPTPRPLQIDVEISVSESDLNNMAQLLLPPDLDIVRVTQGFRNEVGASLYAVAAAEQVPVRGDFLIAERGARLLAHAGLTTTPSQRELATGADIGFGVGRGTRVDGFFRVSVARRTATWRDLDGGVVGQTPAEVQLGAPTDAAPGIGAAIGVDELRASYGWQLRGPSATVEAAVP